MRHAVLLTAALVLLGGGGSEPAALPDSVVAACDAVTAFAEREIGQRKGQLVFSADPAGMGIPSGPAPGAFERIEWYSTTTGKKVPAPPIDLVVALHRIESESAISGCASLGALLDARQIGYGEQAVARAEDKGWFVVRLSMPGASENEAVFAESSEAGPLNGSGDLYYMRRDAAGRWQIAGMSPIWIS